MFIQTEFMKAGGRIEHLTSMDGYDWNRSATCLDAVTGTAEPSENGHSTLMAQGNEITLFYQSRLATTGHRWRYGILKLLADTFTTPALLLSL